VDEYLAPSPERLDAVVSELLRRGVNPNLPAGDSSTLASAVRAQDVLMVRALLQRGADPNEGLSEGDGVSVLLLALQMLREASGGLSLDVARVLPAAADGTLPVLLEDLELMNPALGIVLRLLSYGADLNTADRTGCFPVHVAATIANRYGVHALATIVDRSASRDTVWGGETALSLAVRSGNVVGAQILLRSGANPNRQVADGRTALQLLLTKEREHLFEPGARLGLETILLDGGADPVQQVNIAPSGQPRSMGLLMDQLFREYEPREDPHRRPPPTEALHKKKARTYSGAEEWPIMDMLVGHMRRANHESIVTKGRAKGRFCQECGRSINVALSACNRCGAVLFCRDKCKMRAFSTHHRATCSRYKGMAGLSLYGDGDGATTQWRPRKLPNGKQFDIERWQRSAARPFTVPNGFEYIDRSLDHSSSVRSTPIRSPRSRRAAGGGGGSGSPPPRGNPEAAWIARRCLRRHRRRRRQLGRRGVGCGRPRWPRGRSCQRCAPPPRPPPPPPPPPRPRCGSSCARCCAARAVAMGGEVNHLAFITASH
jgi:ankyrin repeat protein